MYYKKSRGFALAGTLVALVISLVAVGIGMTINERYQVMQKTNNAIKMQVSQVSVFFRAVNQYVEENASGWALDARVPIDVSTLIADGLLPADWNAVTQLKTELRAVGSKINDPGNPGKPANVFVVYEAQSSTQDTYAQMMGLFGYESTAEVEALKRRIGKAYYDKDMLGGLVKAGTSNMHGISNRYTKSLAGYLTVDGVAPQVVAVKGFPDLAEYEPEMPEMPGGGGGDGIGGNATHGEAWFTTPGDASWTVPDGVNYAIIELGGGGNDYSGRSGTQYPGGWSRGGAPVSAGSDIFLQIGSKTALDYTNAYQTNISWLASPGAGRSAVFAVGRDGTKRALAVVGGAGGKSANGIGNIFNMPGLGGGCNDTSPHTGQLIAAGYEDSKGHLTESGKDFIYRVQACVGCNQYENFAVLVGGEGGSLNEANPISGLNPGAEGSTNSPYPIRSTVYGGGGARGRYRTEWDWSENSPVGNGKATDGYAGATGGGGGGYIRGGVGYRTAGSGRRPYPLGGDGGTGYCPGFITGTVISMAGGNTHNNLNGYVKILW